MDPNISDMDGRPVQSDGSNEASDLSALADRFIQGIPDNTFSLATIQGFLLTHKNDPHKAVSEINDWQKKQLHTTE
jgi:chaperone BCS1